MFNRQRVEPPGGELQGERDAVKPMADLGHSLRIAFAQGEARLGAGSFDEQLDGRDTGKLGDRDHHPPRVRKCQ